MKKLKIGLAKEGKKPVDNRVPLTPWQVIEVQYLFPSLSILCQSSPVRCFPDEAYEKLGIPVVDNLNDCDIILGVKEFPVKNLIEEKTYLFFSHTIKKQPYNRDLLKEIIRKKITLIDYECLRDINGNRVIAFGRFAGLIGAYNGLLGYGKRNRLFELPRAFKLGTIQKMKREYKKLKLPPVRIVLTGHGSVGYGAKEVLDEAGIKEVTIMNYITSSFDHPVYAQLDSGDYYRRFDGGDFDRDEFHRSPRMYRSDFLKYCDKTDLFINGTFWDMRAEPLFRREDMETGKFIIRVIADIACDINGPIPSTIRTSTIKSPFYDYDPSDGSEHPPFSSDKHVTMMAIDNLPNELACEASNSFGRIMIEKIFPNLIYGDEDRMIERATITRKGKLTSLYKYLQDYADGRE